MAPHLSALRTRFGAPVSIQSLAAFRFLFGALMVWDVLRFIQYDRIARYYVEPEFHFTYPFFGWVRPLPEPWIHIAWGLVGVFALMVMLGLLYRAAILGFTFLFSYFFLLDKAQYLNHFYLVILFAILLCFLPAHRAFSLDARLGRVARSAHVPCVSVFLLRAQVEIVLIFAGLVKISEDWLRGEPLGIWLRAQADDIPFGAFFQHDWVIVAGAWGAILLHIVGAPLLLWDRTRLPVFLLYCLFHALNGYFFNIGIFPWLTIAATLIFFPPDWPQRLARWSLAWFEQITPLRKTPPSSGQPLALLPLAGVALWVALQIVVPLRSLAFPTEVRWSGDGHRFAWRMRLYDRDAYGGFVVQDRADGTVWIVDPRDFLSARQTTAMLTRSDMILQFAHHLESVWRQAGHRDVAVYAHVQKSLNGRSYQPYVDPAVDLTTVRLSLFGPDSWVLPLTTPFQSRRET
jgi:vitamin K-dependent gamma-carboxylase